MHIPCRWFVPVASLVLMSYASASGSQKVRVQPPAPYGVLPSERQLEHASLETYAFLHFSPNTFTDREWGTGDEDPSVFNPEQFDPNQIVRALKAGGMKGAILTCKHHDGFCLWPTATTSHSIASKQVAKWQGRCGERDFCACRRMASALASTCRHGIATMRITAVPNTCTYRHQLRELLTHYGPLFEVWHDGANGGDGYYGGARETRSIDRKTYYGWPETWAMVRNLQPNACIFSDVGPDLRWVGNEDGYANETCWQTFSPVGTDGGAASPGDSKSEEGTSGTRNGKYWIPAECDVSIRPGWFWHEAENQHVKSPGQLVDLYYKSVGRGAFFLLNVPPNRNGRIEEADIASLKAYRTIIQDTFAHNLADHARVTASNIRGGDRQFATENLIHSNSRRYWATDDQINQPLVEIDLKRPSTFDVIRLREAIQLGQRVEAFEVDAWQEDGWRKIASATSIGSCRLIRLDQPVTTAKLRLRITSSPVCPALYGFGLFKRP